MAEAYAMVLRERVVRAYEAGEGSYPVIAARFALGEATVKRWVWRYRCDGQLAPAKKGGGTPSRITAADVEDVGDAARRSDGGRNYRGLQPDPARPSTGACLHDETGPASVWLCRLKKNAAGRWKRTGPMSRRSAARFLTTVRRIPVERLVFLDESGMHLAMSRSHTWVKRGTEYIDPVPMNWGTTLTLLGAIPRGGLDRAPVHVCDREWGFALSPGLRPTCSRSSGAGTCSSWTTCAPTTIPASLRRAGPTASACCICPHTPRT